MQKYFESTYEEVITINDVKKSYDEFGKDYETFDDYLESCQYYNNGSLTRLEVYIQRLENLLNRYSKYPENDNTELILEIERLKKEL